MAVTLIAAKLSPLRLMLPDFAVSCVSGSVHFDGLALATAFCPPPPRTL
jgi:hypothetical protein